MKKLVLTTVLAAAGTAMLPAATLNVVTGDVTYRFAVEKTGDMPFTAGSTLTVGSKVFDLAGIASMYVDNTDVTTNTVAVRYEGKSARVTVDGDVAAYVTVNVDGANVTVTQDESTGSDTCGEISYVLAGSSDCGSFAMSGSYKATVVLDGLTLANPAGPAIDIQDGKRIRLNIADGTANSLADGTDGTHKGCLVCKGHVEIDGRGALTIEGNTAHGIYAKEYVTLRDAAVKVSSAVKDGLNCNQYLTISSGSLTISGTGDDGIQVSYKDDTDRTAEDTGSIAIDGGTVTVSASAIAAKAIKADGDISITGGTVTASVSGGGKWDEKSAKTKASTCISADGDMLISDGATLDLTATGAGGKGISIDGDLSVKGGKITIHTTGGIFAYVNGTEYNGYTGNTDRLDSDCKSSPKGIKADGNITIDGGIFDVTTTGNGAEGIESKAILTVNGGTLTLNTYDDAINSSSHMYINGGTITAVATNNDALDSNGNMYIRGGHIVALGARAPECGIDANEEDGYTVIFTGGTLLAVGGGNSVPSTSESTQPYVTGNSGVTAGSTVSLKDGDTLLATFTIPANYSMSGSSGGGMGGGGWRPGGNSGGSVLVSCAGLTSGKSYTLTSGSTSSTVTARLTGSGGGGRP
ncbi:MAG: carbohydrate-binding domain-containing protein [Bacteroides sp.]|nr:carbohydrate-binding domain-containing protein [Bacteroides sp.]MCM1094683.1 carbohydrate-binding domain-containing protein [Terasakiella sp.]